jgi:hypothetical protein
MLGGAGGAPPQQGYMMGGNEAAHGAHPGGQSGHGPPPAGVPQYK